MSGFSVASNSSFQGKGEECPEVESSTIGFFRSPTFSSKTFSRAEIAEIENQGKRSPKLQRSDKPPSLLRVRIREAIDLGPVALAEKHVVVFCRMPLPHQTQSEIQNNDLPSTSRSQYETPSSSVPNSDEIRKVGLFPS